MMSQGKIFGVVVLALLALVAYGSLFTVSQIHQAIVLQFGEPKRVIRDPGLHAKLPFIQNVVEYDKRILDYDHPVQEVIALDKKRLLVDAFARYRIVNPLEVYKRASTEGQVLRLLGPILDADLRSVVGLVPLNSLLSDEREEIMARIRKRVNTKLEPIGLEVLDVRIRRADLPTQNSQAIYERMKSEREREAKDLRAKGAEVAQKIRSEADRERTVILAQADKEGEILRGEGDGKANDIYADAFGRDPEFFKFYRSMQAYRKSLTSRDTLVLSPDGDFFEYFNETNQP